MATTSNPTQQSRSRAPEGKRAARCGLAVHCSVHCVQERLGIGDRSLVETWSRTSPCGGRGPRPCQVGSSCCRQKRQPHIERARGRTEAQRGRAARAALLWTSPRPCGRQRWLRGARRGRDRRECLCRGARSPQGLRRTSLQSPERWQPWTRSRIDGTGVAAVASSVLGRRRDRHRRSEQRRRRLGKSLATTRCRDRVRPCTV